MAEWAIPVLFVLAGAAVWWAGSRLPHHVAALAERLGLAPGFAGMLVLGGITSLPELATGISASAIGAPLLAFNNILGSASFNLLLLALSDMVLGARPLTSLVARPGVVIQGVLGMILFALVGAAIGIGDGGWGDDGWGGPVGAWSAAIFIAVIAALLVSLRAERRPMWLALDLPGAKHAEAKEPDVKPPRAPLAMLVMLSAIVVFAGGVLAWSGEAIARETGLTTGIVGFLLVAIATSLPEASAVTGAMRRGHGELAIGEIFGSNIFNLAIIIVIDLVARGDPVIERAGEAEIAAAMLPLMLTGIFVIGLVERRDRTVLRMGPDSIAVILAYGGGLALLLSLAR
ncbi:cation:H+ antiporter [Erythrobacter litoralis]|uniref:Sodium/calcium exchanger membrane region domain-containing protein n=1 Tax=Erythrobacter litoralis TaxID=39960 RepID=A0A074N3D5_9SPHN|nr:sodium:calcium antiporter [Erythrobacter litoralis]AOL23859.1 cation:H+ antiporter [Erythrobacter litoralis]KEO98658.1 hypothetical protein EH32_06020 [Erythrobacter litoralis]